MATNTSEEVPMDPQQVVRREPTTESAPQHDSNGRRWWTAKQAADYVGAGPKEIYKAVRRRKLKAVRLNERGDIRTRREWVDEWMEQKQRDSFVI